MDLGISATSPYGSILNDLPEQLRKVIRKIENMEKKIHTSIPTHHSLQYRNRRDERREVVCHSIKHSYHFMFFVNAGDTRIGGLEEEKGPILPHSYLYLPFIARNIGMKGMRDVKWSRI